MLWTATRGNKLVLDRAGAHSGSSPEMRRAANVVEEMALAAGVPVPAVSIIDDPAPNCLAVGSRPRNATIALTTGLLATLDRRELQAVVAHEIAHVRNGDLRFSTFLAANSSRFGAFSDWVRCEVYVYHRGWFLVLMPAADLGRQLTRISSLAAWRKREYLADLTAVMLTREPGALARALDKLANSPSPMAPARPDLAHLFIVDPANPSSGGSRWRGSHPPLVERVRRLRQLD